MLVATFCGKTGIRTLGTDSRTTVFETAPIVHSGIFPRKDGAKLHFFLEIPTKFAKKNSLISFFTRFYPEKCPKNHKNAFLLKKNRQNICKYQKNDIPLHSQSGN